MISSSFVSPSDRYSGNNPFRPEFLSLSRSQQQDFRVKPFIS